MPTRRAPDDPLVEGSVEIGNVQACKRLEILEWVGKVDYYEDYEPKRLRERKPCPTSTC